MMFIILCNIERHYNSTPLYFTTMCKIWGIYGEYFENDVHDIKWINWFDKKKNTVDYFSQ